MDHCQRENRKVNPRETANIFSLLTFAYVGSLFKKAFKTDLCENDIYEVLKRHNSKTCGDTLETEWNNEQKNKKNISLSKVIWKCYGKRYLLLGLVDFTYHSTSSIVRPYVISQFVAYFTPDQTRLSRNDAYFYGCCIIIIHLIGVLYNHNYMIWMQMFGMEVRTAFSSLLYRKSLRLSPAAVADINLGNIVTLITRDMQAFLLVIFSINDTWIGLSQVMLVCYLMYNKVGIVSFVGIGTLISVVPLQVYLGKWLAKLRYETCQKTDERLQLSQEILSTIRIIKMYTWEKFFTKQVNSTRKTEMRKFMLGFYFKTILIILGIIFANIGFYLLIVACVWAGVSTETSVIFYLVSNFRDLRHFLAIIIPYGMGQFCEFMSSYTRLVRALKAEEIVDENKGNGFTEKPIVHLTEISLQIKDQLILEGISLKIDSGLTVITGKVGSGKSSLLKAILKDVPIKHGLVNTQGRISYASQDPWLFPSSIKQNILFGEPYDAKRYQDVINACALKFDFNLFEKGDETILTDRGLNLSRGQQARINLARAVYRNSEIYLLDDSLTALDATVQEYIFNECIKKYLKDKICILVSQTSNHIHQADSIIVMENGKILSGSDAKNILNETRVVETYNNCQLEESIYNETEKENVDTITEKTRLMDAEQEITKVNVYSEAKKQGGVDWKLYTKYIMYGGGFLYLLLNICLRGTTQYSSSSSDVLLTKWVDKKQIVISLQNNISSFTSVDDGFQIALEAAKSDERYTFKLYSIMIVMFSILELLTTYLMMDFCRRASVNIHKDMIKQIINSVMRFFDTHLVGNILNRLSQDMLNVDEYLSDVITDCVRSIFSISGVLLVLILVNPYFIVAIGLVMTSACILCKIYLAAGRSLKRLEASSRSPMVGHLNATIEGLTTVRSSKVQNILIEEYDRHQDLYTSANFISTCSQRAFGFFIDIMFSVFVIFIVVKYLFFNKGNTAGDVGLSITQVSWLTLVLTWGIRQFSQLENYMTSLERIMEYTDIKTEDKDGAIVENWPKNGAIHFKNVSLSYGNNDSFVFKNLDFEIKPGQKIGIVGRTGAGKSSIISTLFRLYEVQGNIFIDGVDIKSLSLDLLRKKIVVIPQEPVIFSGTIRSNLDPMGVFDDEKLWNVISLVGMKGEITSLEQPINSSTLSFSSGQKQLLCLARAILYKNKIIVMDEATANMDHETDKVLHQIIKDNFNDCTVLTIAHRLHSVLECDKVMVLDRGEIKEFEAPSVLLSNKNGHFYGMVKQAGLLDLLH